LDPEQLDRYWGEIGVHYEPYYAYEELLAPFKDRPRQSSSLLARMETIPPYLTERGRVERGVLDEERRQEGLAKFTARSALDYMEELELLADEYEEIRRRLDEGDRR